MTEILLEYMDRNGRFESIDITQYIGMSYITAQIGIATWLSQNTDLSMLYFLLCPLVLHSGYDQGYELINIDDTISDLGEEESLMLGSSSERVDDVLNNINNISTRIDDQTIINKLNLAGVILQNLPQPYTNDDFRYTLISISDAVELLDSYL
jgi:hypothetical protein